MSSGVPRTRVSPPGLVASSSQRATAFPGRFEEPAARHERLQRTGQSDPWTSSASLSTSISATHLAQPGLGSFTRLSPGRREDWAGRELSAIPDMEQASAWPPSPSFAQYAHHMPITPTGASSGHMQYPRISNSWPAPLLRRSSSEDARLNQFAGPYYAPEANSSVNSLTSKGYPQRRTSNRDEFDGPSQLLDKPDEANYEPKEEDLPQLPINLYAQEQDEILSQVNDRLSQCAFDFVARYQFPIPIEPDKRPVRVPSDREWSEWVYLLKRLATKRRIPSRVLYNGQIKQLITILENSLEMRHAAKHQSRPLKDDRNILQLISSGLQVAKILKDARAMQSLDNLYVQTERVIQSRRATSQATFGTLSIM